MFGHIFKYRMKILLRSKSMIFWTLLFPVILASFFKMAFSSLNEHERFNAIDIAVVDDANYQDTPDFSAVLESISTGEDRLFNLTLTDENEAARLLEDGKIKGYILTGTGMTLVVNNSGISQSIIKSFLDQYSQTSAAVTRILSENPQALPALVEDLQNRIAYTREVSASSAAPDNILNYFYSLIAMACLYGGFFGLMEVSNIQANLSIHAARVNVAPVHKLKTFLYSASAALLIQFGELLILLAYMKYALSVDFGTKTTLILLTTFVGSILGVSFGAFISAVVKGSENVKTAILLGVTMTGCFLAGMMFEGMKYIVTTKAPIMAYINPVNLLTDAFYALYYYDTYTRYMQNLVGMLLFFLVFCLATYLIIRRQKYASL